MDIFRNDLSYNLTQFRINSGLTQEQAAERFGISTKYYGQLERGQRIPSAALLSHIAEVTQIPVSVLSPARQVHILSGSALSDADVDNINRITDMLIEAPEIIPSVTNIVVSLCEAALAKQN